ncbi:Ca(2+)/calmodulin-responsive adenylate cyclase [Portunus trituberculatus]|uniref:Ca(2+)/calmodulin-responsive adenylate cyclase n=1 Tax=Portunus trituberculatus TaxID=210409 RepID=A0A5B7I4F5_PORTR|nr:Ca(2+)/calmodulin-responsive adenylate cyclase [Portunus trituberculatus]
MSRGNVARLAGVCGSRLRARVRRRLEHAEPDYPPSSPCPPKTAIRLPHFPPLHSFAVASPPSTSHFFLPTNSTHQFPFRLITLVANSVVAAAVNVAGVWLQQMMQAGQRKAFLDTRNCIAARLQMEDENEKLVRI